MSNRSRPPRRVVVNLVQQINRRLGKRQMERNRAPIRERTDSGQREVRILSEGSKSSQGIINTKQIRAGGGAKAREHEGMDVILGRQREAPAFQSGSRLVEQGEIEPIRG
jgi:hypothetical protein